jgi:hypothetical protein
MNGNDADRGRCDLSFDIVGINCEGLLIGVAEYDPATSLRDCFRCRDPGV